MSPSSLVAPGQFLVEVRLELGKRNAQFLKHIGNEVVGLFNQGEQQVFAVHLLVRITMGKLLRLLQRRLRLES